MTLLYLVIINLVSCKSIKHWVAVKNDRLTEIMTVGAKFVMCTTQHLYVPIKTSNIQMYLNKQVINYIVQKIVVIQIKNVMFVYMDCCQEWQVNRIMKTYINSRNMNLNLWLVGGHVTILENSLDIHLYIPGIVSSRKRLFWEYCTSNSAISECLVWVVGYESHLAVDLRAFAQCTGNNYAASKKQVWLKWNFTWARLNHLDWGLTAT